ncbi:MAG: hypothetical protein JXN59_04075 [Anaerolineae bacterium]|nr:hypothetical protein [Anaerolineae bacterium]
MSELPPEKLAPPDSEALPAAESPSPEAGEQFATLTLWEVVGRGLRAPAETWRHFWAVIGQQPDAQPEQQAAVAQVAAPARPRSVVRTAGAAPFVNAEMLVPFLLVVAGLLLGLVGSLVMASGVNRTEANEMAAGLPWLVMGFGLWLVAGVMLYGGEIRRWWGARGAAPEPAPLQGAEPPAQSVFSLLESGRLALAGAGLLLSAAAYLFNGGNQFSFAGVLAWAASVVVWLAALAPAGATLRGWLAARVDRLRVLFGAEMRLRFSWVAVALIVIVLVGAFFRFAEFARVPPEMTSDHVEKLLDAQRVLDGNTQVFFPNNGGREPLQMYLVAAFSVISGLGMQFATLKWVSVLEGLITLPALWWMAREIIGPEQRRLGNVVGLLLAALVAVSYWHVMLSRLALRIVLTPLVMALVTVYLARGMRHNRRADFLKAGVALGVGVYCYQAVRMIPVVVVLGVGLAFFFRARGAADRRRYVLNLAALVVIAMVIFVPLARFMIESPNLFWMRTAGRFFGDDVIMETDPETGVITERDATMEDRLNAFRENLPVLGQNVRNVLLMFNWKGDVAWINGAPNKPALDPVTGTFFVLGTAGWLVRMARRRDVVDWIILPGAFIMLLPSALSIAFPVENPSATRTSGALPFVYLLAAYGMAQLLLLLGQTFQRRGAVFASVALAVAFIGGAYSLNSTLYFGEYHDRYEIASQPYSLTGRILRGFAESNGAYGNAFMVAYPYWFDHRAIGIEGGRIDWPNGLVTRDELPTMIRANAGTPYEFDPARSVLFFYHASDVETEDWLREWFPEGSSLLQTTDLAVKDFYTFVAPPPGADWLADYLAAHPPT